MINFVCSASTSENEVKFIKHPVWLFCWSNFSYWLTRLSVLSSKVIPRHTAAKNSMILNPSPRTLPVSGVNVVPVHLRRADPSSPWCYAASLSPLIPINEYDEQSLFPQSQSPLPLGTNFLATQVWPSSRVASCIIERYVDPAWTVCELGCGPGCLL